MAFGLGKGAIVARGLTRFVVAGCEQRQRENNMNKRRVMTILHFSFLQSFSVFGYDEVVDAVLYVAVHKRLQIVYGIVYAVVGDAALRIIVCTDFAERSPVETSVLRRLAMSSTYFWCSLS